MDEQALGGGLVVRGVDLGPRLHRALDASFAGAANPGPVVGSVTIRMAAREAGTEVADHVTGETTGDAGDGRVVTRTMDGFVIESRHGRMAVGGTEAALEIEIGSDTPAWAMLRDLARPGIQVAGIAGGTVVMHAAAVQLDGRAVLISGWSESGKTEVALALTEAGATFVGDKWTIVAPAPRSDGAADQIGTTEVWPFPVRVGIRDWVLPFLPRLSDGIGGRRLARVRAGGTAGSAARRVASSVAGRPALDAVLGPLGELAGLAGTIRLPISEIQRIHGQAHEGAGGTPLGAVIVLTTTAAGEPATARELPAAEAARRLARSAAYERRGYHLIGERTGFHGPSPIPGFDIVERETEAIRAAIENVPVLEVRAPFPSDPNDAARAITAALDGGARSMST
jgi:hypothetical protein